MSISNPRDLVVHLLGELLYVERRLADDVLQSVAGEVRDEELRGILELHRGQTKEHVERIEDVFRRLEVAPTSNRSASFESAVSAHADLAKTIVEPGLADVFHAHAALRVEHWEAAVYSTLLLLVPPGVAKLLKPSLREEREAAKLLLGVIERGVIERGVIERAAPVPVPRQAPRRA